MSAREVAGGVHERTRVARYHRADESQGEKETHVEYNNTIQ